MIGDGDSVGVSGEITEHMLWTAEGRFEVNHPFLPKQRTQEGSKGLLLAKRLESAGENQPGMALFQASNELAAEDAAEYGTWQKEVMARVNPVLMIGRGASGRNHAVNMWVRSPVRQIRDVSHNKLGPCANPCTLTTVLIGCMLPGRKWGELFRVPIFPTHVLRFWMENNSEGVLR
jgi:hypothetical protein